MRRLSTSFVHSASVMVGIVTSRVPPPPTVEHRRGSYIRPLSPVWRWAREIAMTVRIVFKASGNMCFRDY